MNNIKHIVYLMFENRSLDNVLGWLYEHDTPSHFIPSNTEPTFRGLKEKTYYNTDADGYKFYAQKVTNGQGIPTKDPHEDYIHVNKQLFEHEHNPKPNTTPTMGGFYKDYKDHNPKDIEEIMQSYPHRLLPVINGLAKHFAVSDEYYSSLPTQTNCNRGFAATGNSIGMLNGKRTAMVDNHWWEGSIPGLPTEFTERTIWNVLNENQFDKPEDWSIFYNHKWPYDYMGNYCYTQDVFWPNLGNQPKEHFKRIDKFYEQAKTGSLPKFSFIEPAWYEKEDGIGVNGNDYHPPGNLGPGEKFLYDIYHALSTSPNWENTLLIVNFDEHGGTYDHYPPPWEAKPPWENSIDGIKPPEDYELGFHYNRFGVRVPLILISPYIQASTVFRSTTSIPFDHTSVIATILKHFGVKKDKWKMGSRVANAPTFENVLTLETPRADAPKITCLPFESLSSELAKPNDLQIMIVHRMLTRELIRTKYPAFMFRVVYYLHMKDIGTMKKLNDGHEKVVKIINNDVSFLVKFFHFILGILLSPFSHNYIKRLRESL